MKKSILDIILIIFVLTLIAMSVVMECNKQESDKKNQTIQHN